MPRPGPAFAPGSILPETMLAVLVEPEIPPNTGNIARLCAAFDIELHLVEPLGFRLENRYLKRAGLDYWPNVRLFVWPDFARFCQREDRPENERLVMTSAKKAGCASLRDFAFMRDDAIVFGPETRGIPASIFDSSPHRIRIPVRKMSEGGVRSLNLATACGIIMFQGLAFCGLLPDN